MSDRNLVSLAGDGSGVVWLKRLNEPAELLFAADVPGTREVRLGDLRKPAGVKISDLLKLSGITRLRVIVDRLDGTGCDEDAVDVNHCADCEIIAETLWPAAKYCGTIKGASKGIRIVVATMHGHGGETDFDFGGFSDQGNGKTTGCALHVDMFDHSAVKVRALSADVPTLENTGSNYPHPQKYEVTRLNQGWFYPVFNFLKDLLKIIGIKL